MREKGGREGRGPLNLLYDGAGVDGEPLMTSALIVSVTGDEVRFLLPAKVVFRERKDDVEAAGVEAVMSRWMGRGDFNVAECDNTAGDSAYTG